MCFYGPVSIIKKVLPAGSQKSCLLILGLDNAGKSTLTAHLAGFFNGVVRLHRRQNLSLMLNQPQTDYSLKNLTSRPVNGA